MNKQLWIDHLTSWKAFLNERISLTEDEGERIKCERQIKTIERVRCGAVLNPSLLSEFISPSTEESEEAVCEKFCFDLNDSQKKAVRLALGKNDLSLIQGPPGTGKTQVIAEICLQLYKNNPGIRILVCSETHVALNNLISRIASQNNQVRIVRIRDKEKDSLVDEFSPETLIQDYIVWATSCIQNQDALNIITEELNTPFNKSLEKALALSANVAGMTCNRSAAYDFRDTTEMFDVAIIDEVCKATLPEILSPLVIARKAILLGDPRQLPPVFCSEEQEIIRQLDSCRLDRYMYIDTLFEKSNTVLLDTQYRMANPIGEMISTLFYGGNLKNGRDTKTKDIISWIDYNPTKRWPSSEEENSERPRIFNEDEGNIITNLVNEILASTPDVTVGIITPYKAQAALLKGKIQQYNNIKIDTVDGFQGKECDVIIFSVTRTAGSYRFLSDTRRLNVALSRARDRLIIVGNAEYAKGSKILSEIMKYCCMKETIDSRRI